MHVAPRGRGTRHDDLRDLHERRELRRRRRPEPYHLTLRSQPHPFG